MREISVYTKEISPGRWLAATGVAPYFCFEGDSREQVLETAKRALRFYESAKDRLQAQIQITREREEAIPTFGPNDKVPAGELVAA